MVPPTQSFLSLRCPLTSFTVPGCRSAGQGPIPGTSRSARGLPRMGKSLSRPPNRYWPIAAPQGAPISGFCVWTAQGRYAGQYWCWGVSWGAPQSPPWAKLAHFGSRSVWGMCLSREKLSVLYLLDARSSQLFRGPGPQVARALSTDLGH